MRLEPIAQMKLMPDGGGRGYVFQLGEGLCIMARWGWHEARTLEAVQDELTAFLHDLRMTDLDDPIPEPVWRAAMQAGLNKWGPRDDQS